jgi:hypothetical protein
MRQSDRVLLFAIASAVLALAQTDPPGRVGRLSYMNGAVSFRPGDIEDWVPADVNRPLTTGDHLWIDEGARAELNIGSAALRLNSRTAFEFLNLDDGNTQIRLTEGSLNIRVRSLGQDETFEIDTPNLAFSVLRPGEYRIDVNPTSETTRITVRGGEGEVAGGGQSFTVHAREQAEVSGADSLSYNVLGAPRADEWDQWCDARDRRDDQSQSARYVSREMVGYQDLDDNGDWRNEPEYGAVWVPRAVPAGWAPYHYGHWVWVEPWGWTWVDDAPWGFAPFHYGRWAYVRGYWGWIPGPVAVRPVYAPALVAWVGGSRFSLAISVGGGVGIGWFPLGPREVYVPSYRASPRYVNRVNVTNTTITNINVTNIYNTTNVRYVNREAPGAVMAVRQNAFGSRRVQDGAIQVRPEAIRSAEVMNNVPVAPRRENVLGNYGGGRVAQPPPAAFNRTVVANRTPPPAPVPFAQRQQALSANPGRPVDAAQLQQMRVQQNPRPFVRSAQAPPGNAGGFNGRPGRQPNQGQPQQPQNGAPVRTSPFYRGQENPPSQNNQPPVRNDRPNRDVNPGGQPNQGQPPGNSVTPIRDDRNFQRGRENPGGQPPPQNNQPPVRNDRPNRDVNPGGQPNQGQPPGNSVTPIRDDRNVQRGRENTGGQPPPQNNQPPVRNDRPNRDVNPGGQPNQGQPPVNSVTPIRGRENPGAQPPPQNNQPPVRNDQYRRERDQTPQQQQPPPPPRVQRDVPQRVERPAEQPRPPERQVEKQAPKEEKKDDKKDNKKQ